MSQSLWRCPLCNSDQVQISLPTWYREYTDGELEFVETDGGADVMYWYCNSCEEGDAGKPVLTTDIHNQQ